jgi:hypothetical protein
MELIEDAAYCIASAYTKARKSSAALKAVAVYTRKHSSVFVVDGPKLADQAEKARRQQAIILVADKIDSLAAAATEGLAKYDAFEKCLRELHAASFFPPTPLISAVAHAII